MFPKHLKLHPRYLVRNRLGRSRRSYVVSYPKSGRTWLYMLLHELWVDPRFTHAGADAITHPHHAIEDPAAYERYPVIFLYRHPLDVLVSHYNDSRYRKRVFDGALDAFIEDPRCGLAHVLHYNKLWLDFLARRSDTLVLSYEAMRQAPREQLVRVLDFLKVRGVPRHVMEAALHNNSFENLRAREKTGELLAQWPGTFSTTPENDRSLKVRKGRIGGYREEMTPAQIARCREILEAHAPADPDYRGYLDEVVAESP